MVQIQLPLMLLQHPDHFSVPLQELELLDQLSDHLSPVEEPFGRQLGLKTSVSALEVKLDQVEEAC